MEPRHQRLLDAHSLVRKAWLRGFFGGTARQKQDPYPTPLSGDNAEKALREAAVIADHSGSPPDEDAMTALVLLRAPTEKWPEAKISAEFNDAVMQKVGMFRRRNDKAPTRRIVPLLAARGIVEIEDRLTALSAANTAEAEAALTRAHDGLALVHPLLRDQKLAVAVAQKLALVAAVLDVRREESYNPRRLSNEGGVAHTDDPAWGEARQIEASIHRPSRRPRGVA